MKITLPLYVVLFSLLLFPSVLAGESLSSEVHQIELLNVFIGDSSLTCNPHVNVVVELRNSGTENEAVQLELIQSELGIDEVAPIFGIQPQRLESITFPLLLSQEPEAGDYEFEIIASFHNEIRRHFASFTFKGCPEQPKMTGMTDTALMVQSGLEPVKTLQGWSNQTWFLIIMTIILFILVLVYLLKLYIENMNIRE